MPEMDAAKLAAFDAETGAYSEITMREATGDKSITLDKNEKSVLFRLIPEGSFARKGGAPANGNPDQHLFAVHSQGNISTATPRNVKVVYPKKTGNELRLYASAESGIKLQAGDYFYIITRSGQQYACIGTIAGSSLETLGNSGLTQSLPENSLGIEDDDDGAYQNAIEALAAKSPVEYKNKKFPRDPAVALQALENAAFLCEAASADHPHPTFARASSGLPYVEAHHLVPLSKQGDFSNSLDIVENIIALCPNCHRLLHHGKPELRIGILSALLEARLHGLASKGIVIATAGLLEAYGIETESS